MLLAVAPAASADMKAAAVIELAGGLQDALQPTGMVRTMLTDQHMLPRGALHGIHGTLLPSLFPAFRSLNHCLLICMLRVFTGVPTHMKQAALDAVCGASDPADLLAYAALFPAWHAAAGTLLHCTEVTQAHRTSGQMECRN
jgi:hypothetical protein